MSGKKHKSGFTIIELVMVIVILGVLAGIALPKFAGLKNQATSKVENKVISALNVAIKNKFLQNIAGGADPASAWPSTEDIFDLLEKPLPNIPGQFTWNSNDGRSWRVTIMGTGYMGVFCPHFSGYCLGTGYVVSGSTGKVWIYYYTGAFGQQGSFSTTPVYDGGCY